LLDMTKAVGLSADVLDCPIAGLQVRQPNGLVLWRACRYYDDNCGGTRIACSILIVGPS